MTAHTKTAATRSLPALLRVTVLSSTLLTGACAELRLVPDPDPPSVPLFVVDDAGVTLHYPVAPARREGAQR